MGSSSAASTAEFRHLRVRLGRLARSIDDPAVTRRAIELAELLRVRQREMEWQAMSVVAAANEDLLRDRAVALLAAGPMRPSALAAALGVSQPEIVRALRPLRETGAVEVTESGPPGVVSDRRARWYSAVGTHASPGATHEV